MSSKKQSSLAKPSQPSKTIDDLFSDPIFSNLTLPSPAPLNHPILKTLLAPYHPENNPKLILDSITLIPPSYPPLPPIEALSTLSILYRPASPSLDSYKDLVILYPERSLTPSFLSLSYPCNRKAILCKDFRY